MESRQAAEDSTTPHIFRLPVEALLYIFEQMIRFWFDERPYNALQNPRQLEMRNILFQFYSWWRDIVINQSSCSMGFHIIRHGPPTFLDWIQLCLLRSGRHDLHLAIGSTTNGFNALPADFSPRKRGIEVRPLAI